MKTFIQKYSFESYYIILAAALFYAFSLPERPSSFLMIFMTFFFTYFYIFAIERVAPKSYGEESRKEKLKSMGSFILNIFVVGKYLKEICVAGFILIFDHFFAGSRDPLGLSAIPLWLSIPIVFLLQDFMRYWAHRFQHTIPFLWKFHRFHHDVPTINAVNLYRSHPLDYGFRNVVAPIIIYTMGFAAEAVFFSMLLSLAGMFSHCGADLKMGYLNKIFSTNQVHRWHHVKEFKGIGYNFGVTLIIWDILFGTYYLSDDESQLELGIRS